MQQPTYIHHEMREEISEKDKLHFEFNQANARKQSKLLKELACTTDADKVIEKRQKVGQLRYGDVILMTFQEDVHLDDLEKHYHEQVMQSQLEPGAMEDKGAAK